MATTVTQKGFNGYWKITYTSVTETDGTATGVTTEKMYGEIIRSAFIPDTGGTQPTDLFDVEVLDADGYDVLLGQGKNLSNAAVTTALNSLGAVVYEKLTVSIANAGSANGVTVIIYVKER